MEKSGVYIVSHRPLDESSNGTDNLGFDGDEKAHEVHFDEKLPHHSDKPYRGMGKDELLRHSSKGIWKTLRYVCMSIVLLGWLALIVTVIALVIVYPKCRKPESQLWWQEKTTYRIYVRSFQDSDGDGIGDLQGITKRLGYLKDLGVGALSLSPFYKQAPGKDSDFDIVDHTAINPEYGTLQDFQELVNMTKKSGMYLLLDFVPGFTSNEHEWFVMSKNSSDRNNKMRNFYVWEDDNGNPPSNWVSIYNGPAWELDAGRGQYYLHQREAAQPDLNLRSDVVNKELMKIMEYWLDLGVDGFYIRDSGWLLEDYDLRDEPKSNTTTSTNPNDYDYYDHIYTYARPENKDLFAKWRHFLDGYGNKTGSYKLLFADVNGNIETNMDYYGMYLRDGVDFPLNKHFQMIQNGTDVQTIYSKIKSWIDHLPTGRWSNWMGGDENTGRMANRRPELNRPMLMLTMLLPGTPFVYYGDELGMTNSQDPPMNGSSRDQVMRAPMQWDNSSFAGFCQNCNETWIPMNTDSRNKTVMMLSKESNSMLTLFKNLTDIRSKPSFKYGDFKLFSLSGSIISFIKEFDGETGYLVAVNVGSSASSLDLSGKHETLPETTKVVLTTKNGAGYSVDDEVSPSSVKLEAYGGMVASWKYVAKEL